MMKPATRLAAATAALTLFALAGCSTSAPESEDDDGLSGSVVYSVFDVDPQTEAWLDAFSEATGVEVATENSPSPTRLDEMQAADAVIWDLVHTADYWDLVNNPHLAEIDCEIVDCAVFDDTDTPALPRGVPIFRWAYALAYNTDEFGDDEPTGMDAFFDPDIEGLRLITPPYLGWFGFLEAALLYDGVVREDLYPLDVERALSVFDPIKSDLVVLTDPGQCVPQVGSGEAVMGLCLNGQIAAGIEDGLPLGLAWGRQVQGTDYISVVEDAPNPDAAQALVAWIVENNGAISDDIAYSPANPDTPPSADSPFFEYLPGENEMPGDQAPIHPSPDFWTMETIQATGLQIQEWLAS